MKIYYSKYKYIEIIFRKRINLSKFQVDKFEKEGMSTYLKLGYSPKDSYVMVNILKRGEKILKEHTESLKKCNGIIKEFIISKEENEEYKEKTNEEIFNEPIVKINKETKEIKGIYIN
jgi:hypothetical protein